MTVLGWVKPGESRWSNALKWSNAHVFLLGETGWKWSNGPKLMIKQRSSSFTSWAQLTLGTAQSGVVAFKTFGALCSVWVRLLSRPTLKQYTHRHIHTVIAYWSMSNARGMNHCCCLVKEPGLVVHDLNIPSFEIHPCKQNRRDRGGTGCGPQVNTVHSDMLKELLLLCHTSTQQDRAYNLHHPLYWSNLEHRAVMDG